MIESLMDKFLKDKESTQIEELKEFLKIPSVSTQPEHKQDMLFAANWLANHLILIGLEHVEIIETSNHPLIYADWLHAGKNRPTILIYGHYDVQPVEPVEEWLTPPFEPTEQNLNLFARGATDDKGQLFIHIKAIEAFFQTVGKLPVNIKIIAEGDEESGAPIVSTYIKENKEKLSADICLISDTALLSPEQPCIPYSLRGIWAGEIIVKGPKSDLHSGAYGGVVHNPAQALAEIIAQMHDKDGKITINGFYDDVVDLELQERELLAKVPDRKSDILSKTGVPELYGESEYTPVERIGARPTLEINGIWGGVTAGGFKTVIPAEAHARISCRLVPNQDPKKIELLLTEYIKNITPPTVTFEIKPFAGIEAVMIDPNVPAIKAVSTAYQSSFGVAPVLVREGGGIPIVSSFKNILNTQVLLMGFGLPDDNPHAPNEKIHIPNFFKGIRTVIGFLQLISSE